jgi:hypothetical protein
MFSHCIYNRWSDNLAPSATITIETGTAAAGYDPSWIADFNASRPSKLNETSGAWLFDFGSAVQVEIAAIFHSNIEEGHAIHIQANATDSWGSPSLDVSITMPAWKAGGYPPNPWVDLRAVTGAGAYRFWRVMIPVANAVALSIGDVWLGSTVRTFNLQYEDKPTIGRPVIEHTTDYRKLRFQLGFTSRKWTGTIPADNATRDAVIDWILDADGRPVLFIPEHSADPAEAWLALHTTTLQDVNETFDEANFLPLAMEEDGRGLKPTPSPV